MTRRSFISDMLKCGIATTFLPGAGRIWKPTYQPWFSEPLQFSEMAVYKPSALNLNELFELLYKIKERRRAMGEQPFYSAYREVDGEIRERMGIIMYVPPPRLDA